MPSRVPQFRPRSLGTPKQEGSESQRLYDRFRRNKASKAFYHSQAWLRLRDIKLTSDPWCEWCLEQGLHTAANTVHHIIEIDVDPTLRLMKENLKSACMQCHARHH